MGRMKPLINKLINHRSVAIIGMAKNVGKTTLLNFMLQKAKGNYTLGLTSIGRDGEGTDIVTHTKKPKIYVYAGTVIATAHSLLGLSDITLEVMEATGIMTPMGEIIIVRALSDGYIQLAGPSVNQHLHRVCKQLEYHGSQQVICDGALSRKTSASPAITESAILCTGASVHEDMQQVIERTAHTVTMLRIGQLMHESIREACLTNAKEKVIIIDKQERVNRIPLTTALGAMDYILSFIDQNSAYIFIRGVVTDSMLLQLASIEQKELTLVVEDGTKLLVNSKAYRRFIASGKAIKVLNAIQLIAVTMNPTSPYGYNFDSVRFQEGLARSIPIPVIDVCADRLEGGIFPCGS